MGVCNGRLLLRTTEGSIFRPNPTCREVCCLPGARIRDITGKLLSLVRPSDYCLLLVVQAGSGKITKRCLSAIERDFRALGRLVEGSGAGVVILPVTMSLINMNRQIHQVSAWLQGWCHSKNFEFVDHRRIYSTPGLLIPDGTQRGERALAQELVLLVDRTLN